MVTQTIRSGWHLQKIRKNGVIKKLMELQPILILLKQLRKITMPQSKQRIIIFHGDILTHNELKSGKNPFWQDNAMLFASKAKINNF